MNLNWNQVADAMGEASQKLLCHVVVDDIASTNDWAAWSCGKDQLPAVCLAEKQSAGRGRRGREWISPPGENIYLSLVWPFFTGMNAQLDGLSLVAGVAIAKAMAFCGIQAKVKWPNDVLVNGAKVAGILIETKIKRSGEVVAVIGVGINYALSDSSRLRIGQACSDMASHLDDQLLPDRNRVAGMVIKELIQACEVFAQHGFSAFAEQWKQFDICSGNIVQIHDATGEWTGKAIGLDSQCALRVMRDNVECMVVAADVSVRIK
jgi:BirA family transcriptional regulator, biotin operon repressor / biotin---[acetyl-CoA-carboxylase] ligase